MVRQATTRDFAFCVRMSREFWGTLHYDDPFDADHVGKMVELSHSHGLLYVACVDDEVVGFIAGIAMPLLGNGNVLQVTELAYWMNPEHRGKMGMELLLALEKSAGEAGAKYLNMIAIESSNPLTAQRIYERRGFEKIESTYMKRLA